MAILEQIKRSEDVKKLNLTELTQLSEELRSEIIAAAKENGGHLASNLGAVELVVALYHVFDMPDDKLIFDVGHQCYAHKILSDRKDKFSTIRTDGGISGFPDIKESEYDAFTTGHAGTSVAASIGYGKARDLKGENYRIIDVVGDGSFVNGLNLEAVSASDKKPKNLLVILNDNGMSISLNKNGLYKFISKGTTKKTYIKSKRAIKKIFGESIVTRFLRKLRNFLKRMLNRNNIYEQFGFKYVGVLNGNNLKELIPALKRIKNTMNDKAVFLHVMTKKGKGLCCAESEPYVYHGVGKDLISTSGEFSYALGGIINEIIDKDKRVVAITAAMKNGTGLCGVEELHPDNFIDVGIAEEYAVTLAAGMAAGGAKPVVAVYSTFLQRAYDQILHDVCISDLPVIFAIDRAGLVGADGKTHQGVFDLSFLLHIPNMTVYAPANVKELKDVLLHALGENKPAAIRYPNAAGVDMEFSSDLKENPMAEICGGEELTVLAVGPRMIKLAFELKDKFGEGCAVYNARTLKPLSEKIMRKIAIKPVITLEENSLVGGFGAYVSEYYKQAGIKARVFSFGIMDEFVEHGNIANQLDKNGLNADNIYKQVKDRLSGTEDEQKS